jgi:HD superfamily phosphohydrolase
MTTHKKTLIADFLHYPIALSALEKALLATPVFNRLHSVKQNSTAYLTFPGLNHSRFSHSLGAMHLAGELYFFGMLNASDSSRSIFLARIQSVIQRLTHRFDAVLSGLPHDQYPIESGKCNYEPMCSLSPSLNRYVPHFLSKDQCFVYLTALQAVRIAALVHDLGHPPLSHATEKAVEEIGFEMSAMALSGHVLNKRQSECVELLKLQNTGAIRLELHESLTLRLYDELKNSLHHFIGTFEDSHACFGSWVVLELVPEILKEGKSIARTDVPLHVEAQHTLSTLHALVAGDLDADRLDYVQRDLILSGIREGGCRPQRLIELFELCPVSQDSNAPMAFMPSIRAIRSLEEFFIARYDLYRNVVFHHHVVKTDGLLTRVVKGVGLRFLNQSDSHNGDSVDDGAPGIVTGRPSDIRWLWKIFETNHALSAGLRDIVYLQWDDHWLMSVLRREYIRLRKLDLQTIQNPNEEQKQDLILFKQLEDLIGSNANYLSIVKRLEDFLEIEFAFTDTLCQDEKSYGLGLTSTTDTLFPSAVTDPFVKLRGIVRAYLDSGRNKEATFGAIEAARQLVSMRYLPASRVPIDLLEESRQVICADRSSLSVPLLDLQFVQRSIKPGLQPDFLITTENGAQKFSDYSNVARELIERQSKLPKFFLYALPEQRGSRIDRPELRSRIGRAVANTFLRLTGSDTTC